MYPNQLGRDAEGNLGCADHSWYLSVDFQLHLLTPWLLILYKLRSYTVYAACLWQVHKQGIVLCIHSGA